MDCLGLFGALGMDPAYVHTCDRAALTSSLSAFSLLMLSVLEVENRRWLLRPGKVAKGQGPRAGGLNDLARTGCRNLPSSWLKKFLPEKIPNLKRRFPEKKRNGLPRATRGHGITLDTKVFGSVEIRRWYQPSFAT